MLHCYNSYNVKQVSLFCLTAKGSLFHMFSLCLFVLELPLTVQSQLNTLNSPEVSVCLCVSANECMFVFLCGPALNCKLWWVNPDFDPPDSWDGLS